MRQTSDQTQKRPTTNAVKRSVGFCLCAILFGALAACNSNFQPKQRFGVVRQGLVASTPFSAEVTALSIERPNDATATLIYSVQDGEEVIDIPVPIAQTGQTPSGVGHLVVGSRDYRLQAACGDIQCWASAAVLAVVEAGNQATTKSYFFEYFGNGDPSLVASDASGMYRDALTALTAYTQVQQTRGP